MDYSDAINDVISQVPAAPSFVIESAFGRTLRRFCELSTAYRHKIVDIDIVADQQSYSYTVPTGTITHKVHVVRFSDRHLSPVTEKYLAQNPSLVRESGRSLYWLWKYGQSIELYPLPHATQDDEMVLEVSLKPTRDATSIEDWFAEKYYEVLLAGTASELHRVPNTEYYNAGQFQIMEAFFMRGVEEARKEASGADRAVPRRVRYGGY